MIARSRLTTRTKIAALATVAATALGGFGLITIADAAPVASCGTIAQTPVLQYGSRGQAVRDAQCLLNARGASPKLDVDGIFGPRTREATAAYQRSHGLDPDGVIGVRTWASLKAGSTGTPTTKPSAPKTSQPASGSRQKVVDFARAQIGEPYVWGAEGPSSWDCSGLTMMSMKAAGKSTPRVAADQYRAGRKVAMKDLQPGDLVAFGSPAHHVGVYIGGGKMIHAPHPGDHVRIANVYSGAMGFTFF